MIEDDIARDRQPLPVVLIHRSLADKMFGLLTP